MRKVTKKVLAFQLAVAMLIPVPVLKTAVVQAAEQELATGMQNGSTTLEMKHYGRFYADSIDTEKAKLEIVSYSEETGYAYAISGKEQKIEVISVDKPDGKEEAASFSGMDYDVKNDIEEKNSTFVCGKMTSIAVSPSGRYLAVAVQHKEYNQKGLLVIYRCREDESLSSPVIYEAGVQPDMVTFADENTLLCADEGEPKDGYGETAEDPKGTVTIVNIKKGTSTHVGFESFTADELIKKNVLIGAMDGKPMDPSKDLEPEYIAVSPEEQKAYVTLQEANAVATLDLGAKKFTRIDSVGFEDYANVPVDLVKDGAYKPKCYPNLVGARMPDGIASYEANGKTYLVIANEGDDRSCGTYTNTWMTTELTNTEIVTMDSSKVLGIPSGKTALSGGRSFTILEVTSNGLKEVYDSGADFESITAKVNPQHFNCSSKNTTSECTSAESGPEPENVTVTEIEGRIYAMIGLEGTGGIMAYDVTTPEYSMNVNYICTRDYSSATGGDVSPEGLCVADVEGSPVLLAAYEVSGTLSAYSLTKKEAEDIIVLYTNDVHNAYQKAEGCLGYASVAQYKKQLESLGYQVQLVDNGDAIQGGIIGTVSKGSYIKDIMKAIGYSIAIPGNHEFDFQMEPFLQLAKEAKADGGYEYISCNFDDKRTGKTIFAPYKMVDYGSKKVAYIGVCTPESFTKSTPSYFQDENGTFIYDFCEGNQGADLYKRVQETIDTVKEEGADVIVAMSHLGTDKTSTPFTSQELIAHTSGIDVLLDGHSHSTIIGELCNDKNGKQVIISSTGTALKNLGVLRIQPDGSMSSSLIDQISMQDSQTLTYVNSITEKFQALADSKIAYTDITLAVNDPESGKRMVRSRETNLGDLCADAYRSLLGTDIAFVNGGGIRADIPKGDITYSDIIKVHPFGNKACAVEVTGQQILDALEFGARAVGTGENGGYLQVSGITFDIDSTIPTSVVVDNGVFAGVKGDYRIQNVKIGGELLDTKKTYTVASHNYMLKEAGDGYSMFTGSKLLQDEVKIDNQVLMEYITQLLDGRITQDSDYANPYGAGRNRVILEKKKPTQKEDGYVKYQVGNEEVTEVVKAIGNRSSAEVHNHEFEEKVIPATLKRDGKIVKVCTGCGKEDTVVIPKIRKVSLSTYSYVYDKNVKTPKVIIKDKTGKYLLWGIDYVVKYESGRKKADRYGVSITFAGNYKGKVRKSFVIRPKATSIIKAVPDEKGCVLSWKKQKTETTGYQIEFATDKDFADGILVSVRNNMITSKSIKRVKAKVRNYLRIRTYKVVRISGERRRVYSEWSAPRTVIPKK
ncbi:choice-of-anchor I family protein [[Clostridium] polysaccharolyticum]|uniref:2',3'-cyclic-nucleotide 2'-phosphodiesterase/5'-or 3'-nucleotidase, 5'-nucleotidase family n=1 Tax=[Clostridium] polysaccharolyticum TaxID=29364 RepID=A0A1I0EFZ9_9FIRM|nr:choice-of-anchor I family protein [[Clostridium] polysaccharolyticum]SET44207.1 2',3'-cyclic-nucleotide 2'-phosphodiesterase/5'-or 3'-nucleotidase, 5'-nucleotidase family [[Clostridium] polysaccharolyticum]